MASRVVKLTDLIERGRDAARSQAHELETASLMGHLAPIARDIAQLGADLVCISRTPTDNPQLLIRNALVSIESCLSALRQQA